MGGLPEGVVLGGEGQRGKNQDNYNSIINTIYLKKFLGPHSRKDYCV